MRKLLQAIESYWNNQSKLTRFFTGGIHLGKSPNTSDPYVVIDTEPFYQPKSWHQDNGGYEDRRLITVLFWVSSTNATTTSDGVDLIIDTIPDKGFSMEDYNIQHFVWERKQRVETVDNRWTNMLEYECLIEEDNNG